MLDTSPQNLFETYFKDKSAFDDLEKAHYAYHMSTGVSCDPAYINLTPDGSGKHLFEDEWVLEHAKQNEDPRAFLEELEHHKDKACIFCGRTRKQVRWDSLPAQCQSSTNPGRDQAMAILKREEDRYMERLCRAKDEVPALLQKYRRELNGETLAWLQMTHGYDPDSVASALDVEVEELMPDFEKCMEQHRQVSKTSKFDSVNY